MRDTIVKKYGGIDHLGLESVVWNLIMIKVSIRYRVWQLTY